MIRLKNLPSHIQKALKPFIKEGEQPDVFPSKFNINGDMYYYFAFSPAKEQLVMCEDGTVKPLNEIKKVALIANAYNAFGVHIIEIGYKWKRNDPQWAPKLKRLLLVFDNLVDKELSIKKDYEKLLGLPDFIIDRQNTIVNSVDEGSKLARHTNNIEIVTEDDYFKMRQYNMAMATAAYEQNLIQLETEKERDNLLLFLSSQKKSVKQWLAYRQLKVIFEKLLRRDSFDGQEMEELKEIVAKSEIPIEEDEFALSYLKYVRNPQ